jgi:hypothetical protein
MARPISAGWSTQQPFEAARLAVVGARLSLQGDDPVPGTGGLEIQRRRGTQRLQWSEIDKAVWTGAAASPGSRSTAGS